MRSNCQYVADSSGSNNDESVESNARTRLTRDEEVALANAIAQGDHEARNALVQANLRLVIKIAKDYQGRGLTLDDLVGEGNIGLIRAAEDFDPRFGTRFSTYAAFWIKQAIRQALVTTSATIRLPVYMVGLLTKWRHMERQLFRERGYLPSAETVSASLGLSLEQQKLIERAMQASHFASENPRIQEEFGSYAEQVVDFRKPAESSIADEEVRSALLRNLEQLDGRERSILTFRYGLDGEDPQSLSEVGRRFGMTREWARKMEARALRKLKVIGSTVQGVPLRLQTEFTATRPATSPAPACLTSELSPRPRATLPITTKLAPAHEGLRGYRQTPAQVFSPALLQTGVAR